MWLRLAGRRAEKRSLNDGIVTGSSGGVSEATNGGREWNIIKKGQSLRGNGLVTRVEMEYEDRQK